jgi:hypothetical protein
LPVLAFGALVAATVCAFFVTQHLKVTTPLIAGNPRPFPADINPVAGKVCLARNALGGPRYVNYGRTKVSFYLLHRSDYVNVWIVNRNGEVVKQIATNQFMQGGTAHPVRTAFYWDGRESNGQPAPDGVYYIRVGLEQQGRTITIADATGQAEPVTVLTRPPHPIVTRVSPAVVQRGGTPVRIHYTGNEGRSGVIRIYRTDGSGGIHLVKSFVTQWASSETVWDGRIHRQPAPQGTYLIGLDVTDQACNTGSFPPVKPPAPGTTPHAGVTVRYLAAMPPLDPVAAGSSAQVSVDSGKQPYDWTLSRAGARAPVAVGAGAPTGVPLPVALPAGTAGLYKLSLAAGDGHRTDVPLVASAALSPGGSRQRAHVLVVLPALTWQGQNPVDDGDGIPNTLADGQSIALERPFIDGLPNGFADLQSLLAYLDSTRLRYDLTTDVGLMDGSGPHLQAYAGVVLAGSERWIPGSLASALRAYVQRGGHVLSLGVDSLRRGVTVSFPTAGSLAGAAAQDPTAPAATDIFSVLPGVGVTRLTLGRGTVVEAGMPGFASSLAHDPVSQQLVAQLWAVSSR